MDLDMEGVIDTAIEEGVALETNGHRDRLDLPPNWVEVASHRGALFAANSDAHRIHEMDNIANAVATLQKAGVGANQVVNTFGIEFLTDWLTRGQLTRKA